MIVMVCVDDRGGMMFHQRRQSQDRVLRAHVLAEAEHHTLWMSTYSFRQFVDAPPGRIKVDENFLEQAGEDDFCFVEDRPLKPWRDSIEMLIVFRWNRSYPADVRLDLSLKEWTLLETEEFSGSSHKIITKEVYKR